MIWLPLLDSGAITNFIATGLVNHLPTPAESLKTILSAQTSSGLTIKKCSQPHNYRHYTWDPFSWYPCSTINKEVAATSPCLVYTLQLSFLSKLTHLLSVCLSGHCNNEHSYTQSFTRFCVFFCWFAISCLSFWFTSILSFASIRQFSNLHLSILIELN